MIGVIVEINQRTAKKKVRLTKSFLLRHRPKNLIRMIQATSKNKQVQRKRILVVRKSTILTISRDYSPFAKAGLLYLNRMISGLKVKLDDNHCKARIKHTQSCQKILARIL